MEAKWRRRWLTAGAALGLLAGIAAIGIARGAEREALWTIVRLCILDEKVTHMAAPCTTVDLSGGEGAGSVVLKDIVGKTQFLLIPTHRVTGIEDPQLVRASAPNYWRAAWAARGLIFERAGKQLPRDAIGMAINGAGSRSQDQLHIHIDCIRQDVRAALRARSAGITAHWTDLPVVLAGRHYRARRITGDEPEPDPFALLAEDAQAAGAPMREETLAVIGAQLENGKDGFILLAERKAGGRGHSEDLLDHACALAAN